MLIKVNEEIKQTNAKTILELINSLGLPSKGVAVAVNEEIVPKAKWETFALYDGLAVEIYNMVAGG